jgi:muramoyltetrapeptide carboxypeptidase LdcA involved in peptidoglycan recycling
MKNNERGWQVITAWLESHERQPFTFQEQAWEHYIQGRSGLVNAFIVLIACLTDDPGEEFGRTLHDIVMEKVKNFKYPVCFNFPVGHQRNNYALKCGVMHQLNAQAGGVTLHELL